MADWTIYPSVGQRSYLLLLLLPNIVRGQITISIEASDSLNISAVHLSGSAWDIISDAERTSFGIIDQLLKNGVERHSGRRPQDVFVRSPTPWNDLYLSYGWSEVSRILKPVRSKILSIQSKPVIVASETYVNKSNFTSKFTAKAFQDVPNTVFSFWQTGHQLTVDKLIDYRVRMGFGSHDDGGSVSYSSSWGKSSEQTQTVQLGSSSGVEVTLKPRQGIHVALLATRASMVVEVDYEATLSGAVACNYLRKFNGHHFWAYNVNNIMRAANLPTILPSRETLHISYYSTPRLVLSDIHSKQVLVDVPMNITYLASDYIM